MTAMVANVTHSKKPSYGIVAHGTSKAKVFTLFTDVGIGIRILATSRAFNYDGNPWRSPCLGRLVFHKHNVQWRWATKQVLVEFGTEAQHLPSVE